VNALRAAALDRPGAAALDRRWLTRALYVTLGGLLVLHLGVLVYQLGVTLAFPYDLNYGEGYVLNDAVRLAHGLPLYVDLQQFPMVRSPYPPLFPWMWSLLIPLTGPTLLVGRAMEVLALSGVALVVAWNAWRVRCGIWPVLAAVGLVVASPFVYQWAGYARVDLLAVFFAVGGVVAAQWLRGWRAVVLAALLCGLAVWTKQTTVTAAFAVGVGLSLRNWRHGLAFAALIGVPSLLVGAALDWATQGEFVRHVLLGNASNPILPVRAIIYVGTFVFLNLVALAAATWWLRQDGLSRRASPVAVYLPVTLLAAFSAGNGGSSVNYLIEPALALALVVPFAWRALPPASVMAGPLFAVIQLTMLLHWPNGFGTSYLAESAIGRTPTVEDASVGARLDEMVNETPGELIAEPAGFAVRNGREVYVQPIDLRAEQLHGRWQAQPLVDALASGRFSRVITAFNLFPVEVEQAIEQYFSLSETLQGPDGLTFRVYDYEPSAVSDQPSAGPG
jgi:hypothetical protein